MGRTSLDNYAKQAFDFFEKISGLDDPDLIRSAVSEAITALGFEYVTCADLPSQGANPINSVLMNTRPTEYVRRYIERDYSTIDPVVTELRSNLRPYSWGDVRGRRQLSKRETSIMDEATDFNVKDGLIVPVVNFTGSVSIFSPCGDEPNLSPRARAALEIIGVAAVQALKRASINQRRKLSEKDRLTSREREVVQWIAVGKTNPEIGDILGISPKTVGMHIDKMRMKLDASSRTLIVVEALRRGEISI